MAASILDLARGLRGVKILVVEDSFLIATDLTATLRDLGADPLEPASTALKALKAIERGKPDCVVLNYILEGTASIEVALRIREWQIPWVVATTYPVEKLQPEFREVPFVKKPYDAGTVAAAVLMAMLKRQPP